MSHRPIIDAGPGLNFFSINRERLLIGALGKLCTPECVRDEIRGKAARDTRFRAAEAVWGRITPNWMEVLSDDSTAELEAAVQRITQLPMAQRLADPKDLGELMVVAHAVVVAEEGADVTVLIDDGQGARLASSEIARLGRRQAQGKSVGSIQLVGTVTVLQIAARRGLLRDKAEMRDVYGRMRGLDDGLQPIEVTNLLAKELWGRPD
ncbi:hypothetical protein [Amycolatopsis sp. NPDC051061]|uniref:hypothetical protein n=1 Tax=Amycolatopsis sp. NPDC051061 TaxID=3155042 RepID=UPI00343128B2